MQGEEGKGARAQENAKGEMKALFAIIRPRETKVCPRVSVADHHNVQSSREKSERGSFLETRAKTRLSSNIPHRIFCEYRVEKEHFFRYNLLER